MDFPSVYHHKILCYYFNASSEMQILNLTNSPGLNYNRVVFPQERLLFEAFPNSFLEVHRKTFTGTDLVDKVRCQSLQVLNEENVNNLDNLTPAIG
jgi:hypothetical protein